MEAAHVTQSPKPGRSPRSGSRPTRQFVPGTRMRSSKTRLSAWDRLRGAGRAEDVTRSASDSVGGPGEGGSEFGPGTLGSMSLMTPR